MDTLYEDMSMFYCYSVTLNCHTTLSSSDMVSGYKESQGDKQHVNVSQCYIICTLLVLLST